METHDISWMNLFLGYLMLIIPVSILYWFQTGLVKQVIISVLRMTVQLFFVGLYLELIFNLNNMWINMAWVVIMIFIATFVTIQRSELNRKTFFIPVILSLLISIVIIDAYFIGLVVRTEYFFDARFFIPISGMVIGNCMERNIIALNTYYRSITRESLMYKYYLANGATRQEALQPYIKEALKASFNPLLANMAVIGLIALPGVMTGQILGGSSPNVAIKYQIMLLMSIFIGTMITIIFTILLGNRYIFDNMDNLKPDFKRVEKRKKYDNNVKRTQIKATKK